VRTKRGHHPTVNCWLAQTASEPPSLCVGWRSPDYVGDIARFFAIRELASPQIGLRFAIFSKNQPKIYFFQHFFKIFFQNFPAQSLYIYFFK
jgi:hypothetical protein